MAIFGELGKLFCLHWSKQPAPQPASGSLLQAAISAVNFHYLPLAVTLGDRHPYKACRFPSFYLHCSFDQHLHFHMFVIDYV